MQLDSDVREENEPEPIPEATPSVTVPDVQEEAKGETKKSGGTSKGDEPFAAASHVFEEVVERQSI